MNIVAIIQARTNSSRLPEKVLKKINGKTILEIILDRLSRSKLIKKTIIATTTNTSDDKISELAKKNNISCFRGSEHNVLERYYMASKAENADIVVRITGDCPILDPLLVDKVIESLINEDADYSCNVNPPTYPDGLDVEAIKFKAIETAYYATKASFDIEHVTPFIRNSSQFKTVNVASDHNYSNSRWTLDEQQDLEVIENIFHHFHPDIHFSWESVMRLEQEKPFLFSQNKTIQRNEGLNLGSGQKLWKRAKSVIPGGNMLLSKRSEMFLPDLWPAYFEKSKGCHIWDLDGNQYIDMSIMGVGTNILGYANDEVDDAVRSTIAKGNMTTLNCPEEVYLAEKLIALHPWADMVRFARSGGEANAIAIRIARAATGKDKVAICGYHGWHDWYLSANLGDDENLAGHLLPGLEPNGVPKNLKGTVIPFNYNDIEGLESIIMKHDIGTIKMEVSRNHGPENDFLQKVRNLATKNGIVLIFDECTSGFRETFGGLHKKYGVEPDLAMFGKALGNGYAITATIGRKEIMQAAQSTFISSTFWTERIGPTAALKTLEIMEKTGSWETITEKGLYIREQWGKLANKYELSIDHWGLPALTGFTFKSENNLKYKTFITQEMLNKGWLAGNSVYVSTSHTSEIIENYLSDLEPLFKKIKECEDGRDIDNLINGKICHGGFKRLN